MKEEGEKRGGIINFNTTSNYQTSVRNQQVAQTEFLSICMTTPLHPVLIVHSLSENGLSFFSARGPTQSIWFLRDQSQCFLINQSNYTEGNNFALTAKRHGIVPLYMQQLLMYVQVINYQSMYRVCGPSLLILINSKLTIILLYNA